MKISICIPVYNSEYSITKLVCCLLEELNEYELEIILVNDGSKDDSEKLCERLAYSNSNIKFISLRRNFGEHNAVICALNFVTGDYTVIIDDDFQHNPSDIKKLLAVAQDFDVVYSKYTTKRHHWFRNLGSRFHDIVATKIMDKPKGLYLSSFKVISLQIVKEIIKYKGPFPYIDGLILRVTNSIGIVEVTHNHREIGKSNYTFAKLISLWLNMFINFSIKPIRIFTSIGIFLAVIGTALSVFFLVEKIIHPSTPLGWTSTIISILLFSGIQLIFLGVIGEYLGKQYLDQNGTPQWVIKKKIV